ncbi:MAG: ATP-binding protein [Kiritimatiellae bacterium]|jgi:two-component system sensor histidine kinase EvgS|nr:ATP-binding protein [Kiritimatiellia bacterium]
MNGFRSLSKFKVLFCVLAGFCVSTASALNSGDIVFTESEHDIIENSPVLQVWMSECPPYVIKNEDDSYSGIAVDTLEYISEQTGLIFKQVPPSLALSQESALLTEKVDIAPALFSIDEAFKDRTLPYVKSSVYIYTVENQTLHTNGIRGLLENNVAVQKDSPLTKYLVKHFRNVHFVPCLTTKAGLETVKANLSTAYIGDSLSAYYELNYNDIKGIKSVPSETLPKINICFGVSEKNKALISIFNKVIESMPEDASQKFVNDNLTKIKLEHMIDKKTVHKWAWISAAICFSTLIIVLYFVSMNIKLAKEISTREKAEESLKRSQNILKLATEHSKIVVFEAYLIENKIVYGNSIAAFLGYEDDSEIDVTFEKWAEILEPASQQIFSDTISTIKNDKFNGDIPELRYKNAHGELAWMTIDGTVTERDVNNQPYKFVGIMMDVTSAKEYELEIIESRKEAELANKAKSEFLANMSHEIRTPLNAIIGFSQLLSKQILDLKHKTYIDSINVAGKSLLTLINDILDLSKIEAGQLSIKLGACSVAHILKEIEQVFTLKVREKGINLIVEINDDLPPSLIIDELRLRQVLINLVGNAVKFTERGYIKLGVDIFYDDQNDHSKVSLVIRVEDTGIGIDKKQLNQIFAPFKQQDSQDNRQYGGTGLGLSISKRLTEMMEGKLTVTSELGKGSIFKINLFDIPLSSTLTEIHSASINVQSLVYNEETLLIVDDIPSNRILLEELFSGKNLNILTAKNGLEAVNIAKKRLPDLIISDIRMPVMDGIEVAQILKSTESTKHIPIIALTASAKQEELEITNEIFDGTLTKPVNVDELFLHVNKFIKPKNTDNAIKETEEEIDETVVELDISEAGKDKLYNDILPKLQAEVGAVDISAIQVIAEDILQLGEEIGEKYLKRYGKELKEAADLFNIQGINTLVTDFIKLLEDKKI